MNIRSLFSFAKTPVAEAVKVAVPASTEPQEPVASLYGDFAIDHLLKMITKLPDLDETLKQAGISRHKLNGLLTDDEISQAVETRLDALLATPMRLEPSEGDPATKLMEILKPVQTDAVSGAFKARLFGYSVMEAVYIQREDGITALSFLGEKPMEWFEPRNDGRLIYRSNNGSSGTGGFEVDQQYKFFLTRNRPTYARPFGESLLSRLYWPWFFRNNGWKFWGKFLERFGSPLLVGKSDSPVKMVAALLQAHSNAVIGVGREDEVESVGVAAGNAGQAFDLFETAVVRRIQKVVLGQTLTSGTDGGSGNRALGQVHDAVRQDKRNADVTLVSTTMQKVVDALCALNGWPKHTVTFADDTGLEAERATRDKSLFDQGVRFTKEYYQDNYALRDGDFDVTDPVAALLPPNEPGPGAVPKEPAKVPAKGGGKGSKASIDVTPHIAFSKARELFTKKQQDVEALGDEGLAEAGQPLSATLVRAAILAATDAEDLVERLFALVGDQVAEEDFMITLERALYTADVLGYCHAEK